VWWKMIALLECDFPGIQNGSSKFINIREPLGKHRTNYILKKNSWLYASFISTLLPHAHASIYNSSTRLPGECPMASREDVGTLPNLASALQPQVLHAGLWVSFGQVISGNINLVFYQNSTGHVAVMFQINMILTKMSTVLIAVMWLKKSSCEIQSNKHILIHILAIYIWHRFT
jgi:hypothetical protein